jgi:hypothetical protein
MFLQMVFKTITVLKLVFPFVAARENGNNGVLSFSEFGEAKHGTGIIIRIMIAAIATNFAHSFRFFLHVLTFSKSRVSLSAKALSKTLKNSCSHQRESNHSVAYHHDFAGFLLNFAPTYRFLYC